MIHAVPSPDSRRKFPYPLVYIVWIALCGGGFAALRNQPDPSRRHDRMLSDDAAVRAIAVLHDRDARRFAGYDAVHVAYAGKDEVGAAARWIVLCDREPRTSLQNAVVVELDSSSGALLRMREPAPRVNSAR
jgi:hypothetical protein